MTSLIIPPGYEHTKGMAVDARTVSREIAHVVDAIKEYEPDIQVQYIPESAREPGRAAFRLVYAPVGVEPYVMFTIRREQDFTHQVLGKIMANDQRNGKQLLTEFEAAEEAKKAVEKQKWQDVMDEAADISKHVIKSHKNTYVVDENTVIRDRGGVI